MPRLVHALAIHFPSLTSRPDLPDRVSAALDEIGVAAVHEAGAEDAPVWHVFPVDAARFDDAETRLTASLSPEGCRVERLDVEDDDWAARTQAHLSRVTIDRLVVAPPWDVPPTIPTDAHLIVIPPSMGFGTGHHETTRLCLRLLQRLDLRGARVVDVGTGSGVLAIAAFLLGARDVEGVDCDEDALTAARESVSVNGLAGRILLHTADVRVDPVPAATVVTANLTGALLVSTAPSVARMAAPGGALILSGFQLQETPSVLEAFAPFTQVVDRAVEGEWEAVRLLRT